VIAQFLAMPPTRPGLPLPAEKLLSLLDVGVQALVTTQHPVSDVHLENFNRSFYSGLMEGKAVEDAVQQARRGLLDNPPLSDYAAFGTFTVTTTTPGEIRLVMPSVSGSSGVKSGASPATPRGDTPVPHAPPRPDEFDKQGSR
jgi:hypothetical protein